MSPHTSRARGAAAAITATIIATGLSGCGAIGSSGSGDDRCRDVPEALADQVMELTKTQFTPSEGTSIDRLEFNDAAIMPLPPGQQKYGATSILALRALTIFGGEENSSISGFEGVYNLALDSKDEIIAPLGSFSEPFFDLDVPSDAGWSDWAEQVDASNIALDAFGCVDPYL